MRNLRNTSVFITIAFVLILASFWGYTLYVSGFTGPSQVPGSGGGVIVADSSNNIGIGTSTTRAYSKFLVVSSSTDSNNYAIIVLQPNGNPIFVRNDGMVGVATSTPNAGTITVQGNIYSTGAFTGTIAAANDGNILATLYAHQVPFAKRAGLSTILPCNSSGARYCSPIA